MATAGEPHQSQVNSTVGISSSRPELGTRSATSIQHEDWKHQLWKNLMRCRTAISKQEECCLFLQETMLATTATPFLFQLEKTLLNMSLPYMSDGVLYCTLFRLRNTYFVRFIESGVFKGYFLHSGLELIRSCLDVPEDQVAWEQIYTEEDLLLHDKLYNDGLSRKRSLQSAKSKVPKCGLKFSKLLDSNKTGVKPAYQNLMALVQTSAVRDSNGSCFEGSLINVIKRNTHKKTGSLDTHSYFDANGVLHAKLEDFEQTMMDFRLTGMTTDKKSLQELVIPLSETVSWSQQLQFISSLPNYHYWQHTQQVKHFLYCQMLSVIDKSGKYKPVSARNRMLLAFRQGEKEEVFKIFLMLLEPGQQSGSQVTTETFTTLYEDDAMTSTAQPKRRRAVKRLTIDDLQRNIQTIDPTYTTLNRASHLTKYANYRIALIEKGHLYWRIHSSSVDVLALNDVNISNGLFQDDAYVHLTRMKRADCIEYTCTCDLYGTLLQIATLDMPDRDIESADISAVQCCHIRFFRESVEHEMFDLFHGSYACPNKLQNLLLGSIQHINQEVCLLTQLSDRTVRFSVRPDGESHCEVVHLFENRMSCQSGQCNVSHKTSKRKVVYLMSEENLCPHLKAMKDHSDSWAACADVAGAQEMDESSDDDDSESANDDLVLLPDRKETKGHTFDPESGEWQMASLSSHTPKPDGDVRLQHSVQERQNCCDLTCGRNSNGELFNTTAPGVSRILTPVMTGSDCNCGSGYFSPDYPEGVFTICSPLVYMLHGPARFKIRIQHCLARNEGCDIVPGEEDCIHFLSKETGAGDEIGWDFVDRVMHTQITFSSYCTLTTNSYRRINQLSAPFMSPQTFIAWWFSWACKFSIDFRQPCDICKFNPKFLACDGTKIGINVQHSSVKPIESPTIPDVLVEPCHRRNERAFIHFIQGDNVSKVKSDCRHQLLYMSKKRLGVLGSAEEMPLAEEVSNNILLVENVDERCRDVVRKFVLGEYQDTLLTAWAVLFRILSSSHSITSLIPLRFADKFLSILSILQDSHQLETDMTHEISLFSPEIRDIVFLSRLHRQAQLDMIQFFTCLVNRVKSLFVDCREPDVAIPKPGSYNPSKYGRAYYFHPTGEQLRELPTYAMNETAHSLNYDDHPARSEDKCSKIFPEVSRKGTTYLFLWFDPKHYGHCYGYHMIPGSEGRKDPFCSAYMYMEKAPQELFYDFSCQLEEYCMNREPGFWKNTRFFHDVFHGFSHKCPDVYRSMRLLPLRKLNTEVCEQFNAFIQRIKFSARSMSMSKFNHFLQFMTHQWSEQKKQKFQKRCNIAAEYLA